MKKLIWILLLLVLRIPKSEARPLKEPRTVLDYFYLLPNRFFEGENPGSRSNRRKWLYQGFNSEIPAYNRSIIDVKNDYLRFPGDGAQGRLDVAVFHYHGQATIGVFNAFEEGELSFWRLKSGNWVEVTHDVLPKNWKGQYSYLLPRAGTTIHVFHGGYYAYRFTPASKPTSKLAWRAGQFHLQS